MSHANSSAQARLAHFKAPNPAAVAYYGSDSVRYALAQDCAGSIPKTSTAKSTRKYCTASPATGRTGLRRRRTRRPEAFANAQNPCRSSSSACERRLSISANTTCWSRDASPIWPEANRSYTPTSMAAHFHSDSAT